MRCLKCNTINADAQKFCKRCGHELNIKYKEQNFDIILVETYEEKQKKYQRKRLITISLMIATVIILSIMLIIAIKNNTSKILSNMTTKPTYIPNSSSELKKTIDFSLLGYDDLVIETDQIEVDLKIKTLPEANVIINNVPIIIDDNGIGSIVLSDLSTGINFYKVNISCSEYEDSQYNVIILKRISLTIDSVKILDKEKGIILIEGFTQSENLICNVGFYLTPVISDDGEYKAQIILPDAVKEYNIEIIAIDEDGNIGIAGTKVQRIFNADVYFDSAIKVEGSEFLVNTQKYNSKVVKITGEIKSIQNLNKLQIAEFIPSGVHDQSMIVYYYGNSSLKEKSIRTFYGQYMGIEDGKILLHSYMVYK